MIFLTPKSEPSLVILQKIEAIIVNIVMKMRYHPASQPHKPITRKYPKPPLSRPHAIFGE